MFVELATKSGHPGDIATRNLSIHAAKAGATKVDLMSSANDMVRDRASTLSWGWPALPPTLQRAISTAAVLARDT